MEGNISARPSSSTPTVRLFAFGRHLWQLWSGERADDVLRGNCAVNVRSEGVNKELRARNQSSLGNRGRGRARHRGGGGVEGCNLTPTTTSIIRSISSTTSALYIACGLLSVSVFPLFLCVCATLTLLFPTSSGGLPHLTPPHPPLPVSHRAFSKYVHRPIYMQLMSHGSIHVADVF